MTETANISNGQDVSQENAAVKPMGNIQEDIAPQQPEEPKALSNFDVINSILKAYGSESNQQYKLECNQVVKNYIKQVAAQHSCVSDYNVIILYDNGTLVKQDADRIYSAVTEFKEKKPLLLVLFSGGGYPGSAYLIGKLCIEYSNNSFIISVPRMAKSAATLICCAANEIHMGSLSELGPIDPQIDDLPVLGLKNSVEHIAELVKSYPASSDMFASYLDKSLPLINLGYYERVAESAMQYAEKLLSNHEGSLKRPAKEIAYDLVYKYKDHSFVIDKSEGEEIFGANIIKSNTDVYELGNEIYKALAFIYRIAEFANHNFYFIGSFESDPVFNSHK
jgi:ClpP class serine protease